MGKLQQQAEELDKQCRQLQKQLEQSQSKIEELNESKLRLEAEKNKSQIEIEWFKARADKAFKEARSEQDAKRTEI